MAGASTLLILLSSATAVIVLSSTAELTVALQQRSYVLWQLAGTSPARVTGIVLGQLAIVGSIGAVIGWLLVKASRVSPIEAIRSAEATTVSFGRIKILLLVVLAGATLALTVSLLRADFQTITDNSILLVPLITATLTVAGPVVFRPVLTLWTGLIPARWSAIWYLARNSAAYRLGQSTAVDPSRLGEREGHLSFDELRAVDAALRLVLSR